MSEFRRKNGFSWPPDIRQIVGWIFIVYLIFMYYGTLCFSINDPWTYVFGTVFGIALCLYLSLSVVVMVINPGDDVIKKVSPSFVEEKDGNNVIDSQYCNICLRVVGFKAKHCRRCNKCITHFDHHCVWFNNCIGRRNYRIFIAAISTGFIGSFSVFFIFITTFSLSFTENSFLKKEFSIIFIPASKDLWRVFSGITCFLSLVLSVLLGYLLSYHIFLKLKNMSTYEHALTLKNKNNVEKKVSFDVKNESVSPKKNIETNEVFTDSEKHLDTCDVPNMATALQNFNFKRPLASSYLIKDEII